MKIAALLLILTAFGNAEDSKNVKQKQVTDRCPADICTCETVQDIFEPTVFYMMATCTEVPTHLDPSIRYLKVEGEFDVITKSMITTLGINLRKIDFSNCKILRIEKGAFSSSMEHLKSLILSNNKLRDLDEDIFLCKNLEELFLDGNDITRIHDNTFEKLIKLKLLFLQDNMLHKCSFKLPETLFQLDLHDNEIQSFDLDLSRVNLYKLDLCGNHLQQFPFKYSTRNIILNSLCLSGKASNLPEQFAVKFPSIVNLTLEGSPIKQTKLDVKTQNEIRKLSNITTLAIEYFHIHSFEFITNKHNITKLVLKNIKLENNTGIQKVFRTMPFLALLCIDHSPELVKPILGDGSVVSQFTRLHYLSIQHTKLISIPKINIPPSVIKLNIAYNPLHCDCKLSWIVRKHRQSAGKYLEDVAHTTCNTPAKYDEQDLYSVVNTATCNGNSDGTLMQDITDATSMKEEMEQSDHTVLYIILGSCLAVLLVIGIILVIVLSIMKKKRKHQIAPEGGDAPLDQQQQMKQSSSHDMLLKK